MLDTIKPYLPGTKWCGCSSSFVDKALGYRLAASLTTHDGELAEFRIQSLKRCEHCDEQDVFDEISGSCRIETSEDDMFDHHWTTTITEPTPSELADIDGGFKEPSEFRRMLIAMVLTGRFEPQ